MPSLSKSQLLEDYHRRLSKALVHLEYSYAKVQKLTHEPEQMSEETLEVWESFTARFSRVVDIFLTKYIRAAVLKSDPGFNGSLRDFVDYGEKLGLLDSASKWMELRGFRNLIAHEYEEDELAINLFDMRSLTPIVLTIKGRF